MLTMIVNFHEHRGEYAYQHQQDEGIDVSVLLPVGGRAQRTAIKQAQSAPDRFIPFIWPGYCEEWDDAQDVVQRHAEDFNCRGVKFQPLLQHGYPDDRRLYPMYEYCEQRGLVVLWHCGTVGFREEFGRPHIAGYADSVWGIDQVAADFPQVPLVIAHLGGNYIAEACIVAEKHENVYLDTAYLNWFAPRLFPQTTPGAMIEHAARVVGADRVLYGYEGVSPQIVRNTELPREARHAILGGNAGRLLGLWPGET